MGTFELNALSLTRLIVLLGRSIFETYLTPGKAVHDLYALVMGAYMMVLLSMTFNWIARGWNHYCKEDSVGRWNSLLEQASASLRKKLINVSNCKSEENDTHPLTF
jgi:hypothetical protein